MVEDELNVQRAAKGAEFDHVSSSRNRPSVLVGDHSSSNRWILFQKTVQQYIKWIAKP